MRCMAMPRVTPPAECEPGFGGATRSTGCQPCPEGTFSEEGEFAYSTCEECPMGEAPEEQPCR